MDNNALKFPAYFPAKCPPEEATDEECVLFRLCKNLTLTEQDFETRFVKGILFSKIQFQNHYMNESVLFRV